MNAVEPKLPALVTEELEAANTEHPPFADWHQAYAVIREEIEEAREELNLIDTEMEFLWDKIRKNHFVVSKPGINAKLIREAAIRGAAELIQVAAMAQKAMQLEEHHDV